MNSDLNQSVALKIKEMSNRQIPAFEIKKYISKATGFKKTKSGEIYREILGLDHKLCADSISASEWETDIQTVEKPYFNNDTKQFIVYLNCVGKNVVVSEEKHRSILRMYSNWDGEERTINQICRNIQWPRPALTEYLKRFGLSHDSLPLTDEDFKTKSEDVLLQDLQQLKKFSLHQKFEKQSWDEIRQDAAKWRDLEYNKINPFNNFIKNWKPPVYKPYTIQKPSIKNGYSYVVILSDLHYGTVANKKQLVRGETQSTDYTKECVAKYGAQIVSDIKNFKLPIDSMVILMAGDLINSSSPFGTTTKGTPLRNDSLNEELFVTAFDSLSELVLNLSKLAPKTRVFSYPGNHAGVYDNLLCFAMSKYFSPQKNITFEMCEKFSGTFVEKNTFFVCSHGAHNSYKAKAPKGLKLETYIQSLIINSQKEHKNINSRVAIFADLHHLEMKETNDFYYLLAPSMVRGDEYADALSLNSKPAQISLLLDDKGIKSIFNHYF